MPAKRPKAKPIARPRTEDHPVDESMTAFSAEVDATAHLLWKEAGRPSGGKEAFWYKAIDQQVRARAHAEKLRQDPPWQQQAERAAKAGSRDRGTGSGASPHADPVAGRGAGRTPGASR
jgi:hypothetical protein